MSKELLEIPLTAEILSRTPPEALALILNLLERVEQLDAQNKVLLAQNAALEKRITELETRLNRKSTDSNKPPPTVSGYNL